MSLTTKEAHQVLNRTTYETFDELTATLSSAPKQTKRNKYAGNAEYVPISQIEADLDDIYGPNCWQTANFQMIPLGASTKKDDQIYITVQLELQVLHPIFNTWISRVGVSSGYVSHNVITTFGPKLKAEALKNAAKSLGAVFGRDLNRDATATEASETVEAWLEDEGIIDMITNAKTIEDLKLIQSQFSSKVQRHPAVKKALNKRATELRTTK